MASKRLGEWFLTDKGKKFTYIAAGTASVTSALAFFLPHTIFLDQYQSFMSLYRRGFTVPVPNYLKERFEKAIDLAEVNEHDRQLFRPFSVFGFNVHSAGNSFSKYGVIVGLPVNFTYKSTDDIERHSMKLKDAIIAWDTDEGRLLEKALILSENAQLYAMAREIKFRETPKLLIDTSASIVSIIGYYGLTNSINTKFNLYARPLPIRLGLYLLSGLFCFGNYALCKDFSQVYYETKIDKELIKNPILKEGGREFYAKEMMKNVALRTILGKEGEKAFNSHGNEIHLFRNKHVPLQDRKKFFETA